MNRLDYFFDQEVSESELDLGFTYCEDADHNQMVDLGLVGINKGGAVSERGTPSLSVDVAGSAAIQDQVGQRISWGPIQVVDCSVDENSVSTAVSTPGNSKIVSVFAKFARVLSDPRTDGNSDTVQFQRAEGFVIRVIQGAEALTPTPPSLLGDSILLGDITLVHGQTAITGNPAPGESDGDIDLSRAQWAFKVSTATYDLVAGTPLGAVQQLVTVFDEHVRGVAYQHSATGLSKGNSPAFADGSIIAAAALESWLNTLCTELGKTTTSDEGARMIGFGNSLAGQTPYAIAGTTLFAAVSQLLANLNAHATTGGNAHLATQITYAGNPGGWAAGGAIASASVEVILDGIFDAMADTARGAAYIAMAADASTATGGPYWSAGTVKSAVEGLAKKIVDTGMAQFALQSTTVTKFIRGPWMSAQVNTDWFRGSNGGATQHTATTPHSPIAYDLPQEVPDGATITRIKAKVRALGAYGGGKPAQMPRWSLYSTSKATGSFGGATAEVGPVIDASADATAYKTYHDIDSGVISVAVDRSAKSYYLELTGESSTNAEDDSLVVVGIEVTFTTTKVYAGGA